MRISSVFIRKVSWVRFSRLKLRRIFASMFDVRQRAGPRSFLRTDGGSWPQDRFPQNPGWTKIISPNGRWFVATGPVSPESGRDEDPAGRAGGLGEGPEGWRELPPSRKDWLTEEQWVAWVTSEEDEEWFDPGEDPVDPEDDPGFG